MEENEKGSSKMDLRDYTIINENKRKKLIERGLIDENQNFSPLPSARPILRPYKKAGRLKKIIAPLITTRVFKILSSIVMVKTKDSVWIIIIITILCAYFCNKYFK